MVIKFDYNYPFFVVAVAVVDEMEMLNFPSLFPVVPSTLSSFPMSNSAIEIST